ncbi:MAG TPA: ribonuclease P protein component [Longilinea sp.]|nr:ribonuclease P protein component [Longilinea sp.]
MKREARLSRSLDFKRVRRTGRSYAHPLFVLLALPSGLSEVRVGFITSKAVGGAVERNRTRRRLRAAVDELFPSFSPGWDMIIIARRAALIASFDTIKDELRTLTIRAGAWNDRGM